MNLLIASVWVMCASAAVAVLGLLKLYDGPDFTHERAWTREELDAAYRLHRKAGGR